MGDIRACGLCGGHLLDVILDMGSQPLAENFTCKDTFPLVLLRCRECTLLQLSYQVDPKLLFPDDHPYRTGLSPSLVNHHHLLAAKAMGFMDVGDVAVDIGCNDGSLLDGYTGHGVQTIGVEPTGAAEVAKRKGHIVYQGGWDHDAAEFIRAEAGPAKIVTAMNVMAHVPDPHGFTRAVRHALAGDGLFICENGDAARILGGSLQIDTVYHEHYRFYTPATLTRLLAANGLQVVEVTRTGSHGGSFRAWATPDPNYGHNRSRVQSRAVAAATGLRKLCGTYPAGQVWGIAASTRATPLIHFAGIAPFIEAVTEPPGSHKIGHTIPGTTIPIVDEAQLVAKQPQAAILFAWHIKDQIIPGLRQRGYHGTIILPLPEPTLEDE